MCDFLSACILFWVCTYVCVCTVYSTCLYFFTLIGGESGTEGLPHSGSPGCSLSPARGGDGEMDLDTLHMALRSFQTELRDTQRDRVRLTLMSTPDRDSHSCPPSLRLTLMPTPARDSHSPIIVSLRNRIR